MIKKIIYIFLFLVLLANLCWNGKPVWKHLVNATEEVTDKGVPQLKKAGEALKRGIKSSKEATEQFGRSIKQDSDKIQESIKNTLKRRITEKDKEELRDIIKKNTQKSK